MSDNETRQSPEYDRVFRALNRRLLIMSGYTKSQIQELGDLAKLTGDELHGLLRRKTGEQTAGPGIEIIKKGKARPRPGLTK